LANEIPVLFYEYGHNLTKIMSDVFNYLSSGLMCYNFEELLERSNSLLFNNSSKLKNKITELNRKIYYVKEKGNVKNKIINSLENLIGTI
jgi:3-deoxy-D-manno-octulosonic-acid transferase